MWPSKDKCVRSLSYWLTVCKLMISIILDQIRPWYEAQLTDEQNGLRKSGGTTDRIFTVKRIHQISHRKTQPLYLLFINLTTAFDHIPRDWKMMLTWSYSIFWRSCIKHRYHSMKQWHHFVFHWVFVKGGALLFNLYIDYVRRDKLLQS